MNYKFSISAFLFLILFIVVYLNEASAQWIQLNTSFGKRITGLHVSNSSIYVSTDSNGVYFSSDGGSSWVQRNSGLTNLRVLSLTKKNNTLAIGTRGAGVFISTNDGISWSVSTTGMTLPYIYALLITTPNNYILAGSGGYGGYISTNNGSVWSSNLTTTWIVSHYFETPAGYYLCTAGPVLFKSTNEGLSWNQIRSASTNLIAIATTPRQPSGFNIFVSSLDGIFRSTNDGASWTEVNSGLDYRWVTALVNSGINLFAGSNGGGVYLSTNNGTNWSKINTGLTNLFITKLFIDGGFIYAATENGVVYRRTLSEVITSVDQEEINISTFSLNQNFPNPFNPSTKISWQSPVSGYTTLKVYDVLGKEVATLVNEYLNAGSYEVEFNAGQTRNLSSGIYFYKLQVGEFVQTKKMILAK
ncbi:MAG: T9SS type A sorting domain-containing protein [Ignavibacteria bacterium]